MNDVVPIKSELSPQGRLERDSSALEHARNTGAEWGRQAALELLRALQQEDPDPVVRRVQAELGELRSKIDAAHGITVGNEWHDAAMSALEAALPLSSDVEAAA
jgi:hypothetical protein